MSNGRFSDQQLWGLRRDFDEHKRLQDARWADMQRSVEMNAEANKQIAKSLEHLAANTEGVVQLYSDWQAAQRLGKGVRRFLAWLGGLGATGAAIAAALSHGIERLGG